MGLDLLKTTRMHKPGVPGKKNVVEPVQVVGYDSKSVYLTNKTIFTYRHVAAYSTQLELINTSPIASQSTAACEC